ncbi:hypothetical protein AOC36_02160 [Erysipelothrix larvae]|uniref:Uncharacterized protein n=1 Tax=Erysipelothrix larvae TaxID=1514105 RepID=A0A0X8GYM7_9FIRM|nr:hypothetical protein [Erysipelothrix larvae]AMC92829.1 hypothetical protein AOC36_02160 [Erysipelothrix larvae]
MLFHTKVFETRDERLFQEICTKLDSNKVHYKVKTVDTNNNPEEDLGVKSTLRWAGSSEPPLHETHPVINNYMIFVKKEIEDSVSKILTSKRT